MSFKRAKKILGREPPFSNQKSLLTDRQSNLSGAASSYRGSADGEADGGWLIKQKCKTSKMACQEG